MKSKQHNQLNSRKDSEPLKATDQRKGGDAVMSYWEPYVDADEIAAFLGEPRKVVVKMAREGTITSYPSSGRTRHTYKFKRSEVDADMAKLRRLGKPSVPKSFEDSDEEKD